VEYDDKAGTGVVSHVFDVVLDVFEAAVLVAMSI
jgi:hypothetical protein